MYNNYSDHAVQKAVDASTGNFIEPRPISTAAILEGGFLIADYRVYEEIAKAPHCRISASQARTPTRRAQ